MSWLDYFLILSGLLIALYFYLTKNFDFFEKRGISYEKKPYPIVGSMLKIMLKRESFYEISQRYVLLLLYSFSTMIFLFACLSLSVCASVF